MGEPVLRLGPSMSGTVRSVLLYAALAAGAACSSGGPGREPVSSLPAADAGGQPAADARPAADTNAPESDAEPAADTQPAADAQAPETDSQPVVVPERPARTARGCPAVEESGRALFEIPRAGEVTDDFYRLPFPNDLRRVNGKLDPRRAAEAAGRPASVRRRGEVPGGGGQRGWRLRAAPGRVLPVLAEAGGRGRGGCVQGRGHRVRRCHAGRGRARPDDRSPGAAGAGQPVPVCLGAGDRAGDGGAAAGGSHLRGLADRRRHRRGRPADGRRHRAGGGAGRSRAGG